MIKDHIRDYATEAFRFYATVKMSAIEYREKIRAEAIENIMKKQGKTGSKGSPTESQLIYADKVVEEKISEIKDLEAVEKVLNECESQGFIGREMKQVIEIVYFTQADKPIRRGEIRDRVLKACSKLNISESTTYRYLKRARLLFAHNRGLRSGEIEKINYH